jgi:magnesium chelatase family protein
VILSRAGHTVRYPAEFQLVAAMNPCPCGFLGDSRRACLCGDEQLLRYRRRVSGPLLDRIDLHVDVPAVPCDRLQGAGTGESTAEVSPRVRSAREIQRARGSSNARLRGGALRRHCALDIAARDVLARAAQRLGLSARAHDRILRVARTIADLEGAARVEARHLLEAVQYRALDRPATTEAK